jgi:hypothetical protein
MAGNLIARAIANDDPTWKLFTPFELVWAGGKYGRALAQLYYWTRRCGDALAERRAQFGEFGFRRAASQAGAVDRNAVDEAPPDGEEDPLGGETAVPRAEMETAHVDMHVAAVDPEPIPAEEPPPMALGANRHEHQEKSDDADA